MKELIILSGVPGSGKTTLGNRIVEDSGGSAIMISSDDVRFELTGSYNDFNHPGEKKIWPTIIERAKAMKNMYDVVVIDSTALTNKKRMFYWSELHKHFDKMVLMIQNTPLETCLERNRLRERQVPESAIREMFGYKQEPDDRVVQSYTQIIEFR